MKLNDLCGMHKLRGVDIGEKEVKRWGYIDTSSTIRFILDGVTYEAVENPDDGYRSYMEEIHTTSEICRYIFLQPVDVLCSMDETEENDILIFKDVANGKTILRIGTEYTNDYYPYCVFEWMPENMACNDKGGE
jgi:hypothetical protein